MVFGPGDCTIVWLARILVGFLFHTLGAASAESYGRDRFAENAGFGQHRFGTSAEIAAIKLNEIEDGLHESYLGNLRLMNVALHTGSNSPISVAINESISGELARK